VVQVSGISWLAHTASAVLDSKGELTSLFAVCYSLSFFLSATFGSWWAGVLRRGFILLIFQI